MKKKMSILGALVLAVVVTAASVSGTYAKYTSSFSASDNATVAKWVVTESDAQQFKLFETTSNNATANNLVAPGGAKTASFEFSVDAEVDYTISVDNVALTNVAKLALTEGTESKGTTVTAEEKQKLTDAKLMLGDDYAPIMFTLTAANNNGHDVTATNNIEAIKTALKAILEDKVTDYGTVTIGWSWAYEQDAGIKDLTNRLDTELGKAYNGKTITVTVNVTATQDAVA